MRQSLSEGFSNHRCITPGCVPYPFHGTITPSVSPPITLSLISFTLSDSLPLYLCISSFFLSKSLLCHLAFPSPLPLSLPPLLSLSSLPATTVFPPSSLPSSTHHSPSNLAHNLSGSWHGMIKGRPQHLGQGPLTDWQCK